MAGLSACGKQEQKEDNLLPAQNAYSLSSGMAEVLDQIATDSNGESSYVAMAAAQLGLDETVLANAVASWMSSSEDMGSYVETVEVIENSMECENGYIADGTVRARIKGSNRSAIIEIVCKDKMISAISVNIEYTTGENMKKAALNTLLGMGTVFSVLILISFIIAAFGLIPKLTEKKNKPEEKKADNVVAQIAEREEISDDTELVAVISAAIAAYEGSGSTDGFVVRSIRRTGRI